MKTSAATGEARLQGDHRRLADEIEVLQKRLTHANTQLDIAISERNKFEVHANKSDRELNLVKEEHRIVQVQPSLHISK